VTTIPPDNVAPGQTGHIDAHNSISDVLTEMDAELSALPAMQWGIATLTAGSVSVTASSVTAGSVVLVSRMSPAGTLGHLSVPALSAGSGFTIASSSGTDASTVGWLVLS
jgi:selenophosphate synthase